MELRYCELCGEIIEVQDSQEGANSAQHVCQRCASKQADTSTKVLKAEEISFKNQADGTEEEHAGFTDAPTEMSLKSLEEDDLNLFSEKTMARKRKEVAANENTRSFSKIRLLDPEAPADAGADVDDDAGTEIAMGHDGSGSTATLVKEPPTQTIVENTDMENTIPIGGTGPMGTDSDDMSMPTQVMPTEMIPPSTDTAESIPSNESGELDGLNEAFRNLEAGYSSESGQPAEAAPAFAAPEAPPETAPPEAPPETTPFSAPSAEAPAPEEPPAKQRVKFACPICHVTLSIKPVKTKSKLTCPRCQTKMTVDPKRNVRVIQIGTGFMQKEAPQAKQSQAQSASQQGMLSGSTEDFLSSKLLTQHPDSPASTEPSQSMFEESGLLTSEKTEDLGSVLSNDFTIPSPVQPGQEASEQLAPEDEIGDWDEDNCIDPYDESELHPINASQPAGQSQAAATGQYSETGLVVGAFKALVFGSILAAPFYIGAGLYTFSQTSAKWQLYCQTLGDIVREVMTKVFGG